MPLDIRFVFQRPNFDKTTDDLKAHNKKAKRYSENMRGKRLRFQRIRQIYTTRILRARRIIAGLDDSFVLASRQLSVNTPAAHGISVSAARGARPRINSMTTSKQQMGQLQREMLDRSDNLGSIVFETLPDWFQSRVNAIGRPTTVKGTIINRNPKSGTIREDVFEEVYRPQKASDSKSKLSTTTMSSRARSEFEEAIEGGELDIKLIFETEDGNHVYPYTPQKSE